MMPFLPRLAALASLVLGLLAASASAATDANGDPLPPFARLRLGTQRFRTSGPLQAIRLLPERDTLLTIDTKLTLRWWEIATGKELRHFQAPARGIVSPDGRTLAILEANPEAGVKWGIRLVDTTTTGKVRAALRTDLTLGHYQTLAFSADGETMAALDPLQKNAIRLWRTADGQELDALRAPANQKGNPFVVEGLRFSPDGKRIAARVFRGETSNFCIWDVASHKVLAMLEILEGQLFHRNRDPLPGIGRIDHQFGLDLVFSLDGRQAAVPVVVKDKTGNVAIRLRLWEVATGKHVRDLGDFVRGIGCLTFDPTGSTLAAFDEDDKKVSLIDTATGKERAVIKDETRITALAFSPDGQLIALGNREQTLRLCEVAGGKEVRRLEGYDSDFSNVALDFDTDLTEDLAFTPDGRLLLVKAGMLVRCFRVADGKEMHLPVHDGHTHQIEALTLSADGRRLMSASADATVRIWDTASGKQLHRLETSAYSLALAPDGKVLAVGLSDGTIQLWDPATGKEIRRLKGHHRVVTSLTFTSSDTTLISGSWDGRVLLWNLSTATILRQFAGPPPGAEIDLDLEVVPRSHYLSPDGRTLAVCEEAAPFVQVNLLEMSSGKKRGGFRVKDERASVFLPDRAAFAPDGQTLAWTVGRNILLWDVARGREIRRFGVAEGFPASTLFSPDGKHLLAVNGEGAVYVWETATGTVVGQMTGHRGAATALAISSNGRVLASGGMDTTVLLWDLPAFLTTSERDRR